MISRMITQNPLSLYISLSNVQDFFFENLVLGERLDLIPR